MKKADEQSGGLQRALHHYFRIFKEKNMLSEIKTHEIKILEDFADAVFDGTKTFEIRENDRGYQKGDYVTFVATDRKLGTIKLSHPINNKIYEITYVMSGYGIKEGWVVFGIKLKQQE